MRRKNSHNTSRLIQIKIQI